jgi:ribosomal protein L37AE/L43A
MAKNHRGKGIRDQYAHGRGECPVCKRNNVKVLYEHDAGGQKIKTCKICKAAVKHGKKSLPAVPQAAAEATPA